MEEHPNADSKCIGKLYSKKDKGSGGSKRGAGGGTQDIDNCNQFLFPVMGDNFK